MKELPKQLWISTTFHPEKLVKMMFILALRLFLSDFLFKEKFGEVCKYLHIYIIYTQNIAKFSHIPLRMSDFSTRCRALGVEDLVNIL